jgi:hypothetical protein
MKNNIVISLFYGDLEVTDTSTIEGLVGMVKYSAPFEDRGTPVIGSYWNALENKFE